MLGFAVMSNLVEKGQKNECSEKQNPTIIVGPLLFLRKTKILFLILDAVDLTTKLAFPSF
ncbi:hypothetical protein JCM19053_2123 [Vibrio sp. JCM 19053]|nr:hypothetical protein JCM19053_2123 [Vibrio sp. JCM 19053]